MLFTRTAERRYAVGFDLREDFCQISYYVMGEAEREPVTFSQGEGAEDFHIPTALCKKNGVNQWFCGKEAIERAAAGEGTLVTGLFSAALRGAATVVGAEEYDACGLLALFVRRCFAMLASKAPTEQIAAVMFTTERMTKETAEMMVRLRRRMELPVEHVYCETHGNSFYNYMLMQQPSLREREALLCECAGDGRLTASRLVFNEKTTPVVVFLEKKEYAFGEKTGAAGGAVQAGAGNGAAAGGAMRAAGKNGTLAGGVMQPGAGNGAAAGSAMRPEEKDEAFLAILGDVIGERRPASAYLIGDGFKGGWMRKSLTYLCYQRRVFQGNNLYSKGAAYGAMIRLQPPAVTQAYFFLGKSKLKANVGMQALKRGQNAYHAVLDAGENWYEVDKTEEYILESGNTLQLIVTPLTGEAAAGHTITLEGLPVRPARACRVRVRYTMPAPGRLNVRVEDLGFGEICPASDGVWEQELAV